MPEFNIYAWIILTAIIIEFLIDIVSNYLNLRSLSENLPKSFEGVYKPEEYTKSQRYTRTKTSFGLIHTAFDLAVLLAFWFAGGFSFLDYHVRSYEFSPELTGIIYFGVLIFFRSLISFPFSVYGTFVIEEKFGFNKTTIATFITDRIKGLLLGVIIGVPLLYALLWFFGNAGSFAWAYAWGFVTAITMIMQYIAPIWIMPLFNKFTPLEDGTLKTTILDYAKSVNFNLSDVTIMDGSKRSSKANAFFTGFGKNKRIALFDTLVEKHTTNELLAILAHEIGHSKKMHQIKGMVISAVHTGVLFYLLSLVMDNRDLFAAFGVSQVSVYGAMIFFTLLFSPVEIILGPLMNILSRKHEFEADDFAKTTTGKNKDLVNALKKLSVDNLSNLTPHPFYVFLNYSHPPVLQRIETLQK